MEGLDSSGPTPFSSVPQPPPTPPWAHFMSSHYNPFITLHTHWAHRLKAPALAHYSPMACLEQPHPDWTALGTQHLLQEAFLAFYSTHLSLAGLGALSASSACPDHHFYCGLPSSFICKTESSQRGGTGDDSSVGPLPSTGGVYYPPP